jgi:hypothetical protein
MELLLWRPAPQFGGEPDAAPLSPPGAVLDEVPGPFPPPPAEPPLMLAAAHVAELLLNTQPVEGIDEIK